MTGRTLSLRHKVGRHAVLLTSSLIVLFPFIWMASLSLKPPGEIFASGFSLLPERWYLIQNYTKALTAAPFGLYLLNGLIVCSAVLVLQITTSTLAAYALAKIPFKGRDVFFGVVLISILIPQQILALPLFILFYNIGLLNTYAALILPYAVSPFGIFLFRQFFRSISDEVVHAARLDGLSELSIVFRIILPMSRAPLIAFATFSIVGHWNDLFWPLIAVSDQKLMPPALGVLAFRTEETGIDYGPLMAAATLVVAPLLVAFVSSQRRVIDGLTYQSPRQR